MTEKRSETKNKKDANECVVESFIPATNERCWKIKARFVDGKVISFSGKLKDANTMLCVNM